MLNIIHNNENIFQVKTVSAAWNKFRKIRNEGGTGTLVAENAETKEIVLDVILKVNTKGKVEFRNRNKEDAKAKKKMNKEVKTESPAEEKLEETPEAVESPCEENVEAVTE